MTTTASILAPSPWTGRLVPCTVEAGWFMSQCGPVSKEVPIVAASEALAWQVRGLGYDCTVIGSEQEGDRT